MSAVMLNLNIAAWASTEAGGSLADILLNSACAIWHERQLERLIMDSSQVNVAKVKEYPCAFSLLKY